MGGFVDKTDRITNPITNGIRNYDALEIIRAYVNADVSIASIEMDRGVGYAKIVYTQDGYTNVVVYDCGILKEWYVEGVHS